MLEKLKEEVLKANLLLPKYGLITLTWGNVSAFDQTQKLVVIKPSGVEYDEMKASDMVVCDIQGNVVEGNLRPSSDLPTHLELYQHFPDIGSVVHTHSCYASAWAQAGNDIPVLGTTHGDYFFGSIPCTREMYPEEIEGEYEKETGKLIWKTFQERNLKPLLMPGILVRSHGPFTWGETSEEALQHAVVLEELARMAIQTRLLKQQTNEISNALLQRHFMRKHGENAYYGQKK